MASALPGSRARHPENGHAPRASAAHDASWAVLERYCRSGFVLPRGSWGGIPASCQAPSVLHAAMAGCYSPRAGRVNRAGAAAGAQPSPACSSGLARHAPLVHRAPGADHVRRSGAASLGGGCRARNPEEKEVAMTDPDLVFDMDPQNVRRVEEWIASHWPGVSLVKEADGSRLTWAL